MPDSIPDHIMPQLPRDVHCFFGLPVDNLTLAKTKRLLRERASLPGQTILSTINVNWVVQSFSDPEFRKAILNSDIVTLDGKPLLWLAKSLGLPVQETVPGSTLIQALLEETTEKPLTIFLFGGEGNAAELAMEKINQRQGGLRAVGALNPGFGKVEELSTPHIIDAINRTQPDILLVALGAKKGSQWIEYNRERLEAKIISHLGATINFLAGSVQRAPHIMQKTGTEWLWRIWQEPKLFSRYASDGIVLLSTMAKHFPLWLEYFYARRKFSKIPVDNTIVQEVKQNHLTWFIGNNLRELPVSAMLDLLYNQPPPNCSIQTPVLEQTAPGSKPPDFSGLTSYCETITFDFETTRFADSGALGKLLLLHHRLRPVPVLLCNPRIARLFRLYHLPCITKGQRSGG